MLRKILNGDTVFGTVTLLIGLMFYVSAMQFSGVTADGDVHEGFFPTFIAVIVIIMSLVLIYKGIRYPKSYFVMDDTQKENFKTFLQMALLFITYILAWPFVPFVIQTTILMTGLGLILKQSKKFSISFALICSFGLYALFVYGFNILL